MKLDSLKTLYVHELNDQHNAQGLLLKLLPRLAQAACSEGLRLALERYVGQAQDHTRRLDRIFSLLKEWPVQSTCKAMKGVLEEAEEMIGAEGDPVIKDLGLISAAKRVAHYKMAGVGCARTYAEMLGEKHPIDLLQKIVDEERAMDESLGELAEGLIPASPASVQAAAGDERATALV